MHQRCLMPVSSLRYSFSTSLTLANSSTARPASAFHHCSPDIAASRTASTSPRRVLRFVTSALASACFFIYLSARACISSASFFHSSFAISKMSMSPTSLLLAESRPAYLLQEGRLHNAPPSQRWLPLFRFRWAGLHLDSPAVPASLKSSRTA